MKSIELARPVSLTWAPWMADLDRIAQSEIPPIVKVPPPNSPPDISIGYAVPDADDAEDKPTESSHRASRKSPARGRKRA